MAGTVKLLGGRGWYVISQIPSLLHSNTGTFSRILNRPLTSYVRVFPNISKEKLLVQYRQLNPQRSDTSRLLETNKSQFDLLNGFPKTFFFRRKNEDPKGRKRRVPKLILIQNPFTWLMIKIDFSVLRNVWDPSFEEKEFKFGTKQVR